MNFIIPLLLIFYLQVMPPPPPSGGSELQGAIITNDLNGDSLGEIKTKGWWMKKALDTPYCLGGATSYCDYLSIIIGLENGFIKINERQEVWYLWNRASESQKTGLCQILLDPFKNLTGTVPYKCRNGDYDVPVPFWLKLLFIHSFIYLWFRYFGSGRDYLKDS